MSNEPFFICECGSTVLALSHTWINRSQNEEVGFIDDGGRYTFNEAEELGQEDVDHEWVAYCGGCGKGVTVEWLEEGRVRVLLQEKSEEKA